MGELSPVVVGGVASNHTTALAEFEANLVMYLKNLALPSEGICVSMEQRGIVVSNLANVINQLEPEQKASAAYISKFVAAVASGLFDAALSYLWDETIINLRVRVAQYDLVYFYDNAVQNQNKRKTLQTQEDLVKLDDSELINGSRSLGLISELGFRHLDHIRFMRNWVSAAHPNHNEVTGFQLLSMLETCIREVISLPISNAAVEIQRLLRNIRQQAIDESSAREIATFFGTLSATQANNLAMGFFGIYTREDSAPQSRQNVALLAPHLWQLVEESIRQQFGIRYANYAAHGEVEQRDLSREFLDLVGGSSYIPDDLRSVEISIALENLLLVHRSFNNFYTEPPLARELQRLVGELGHLPSTIENEYIHGLVELFLSNGSGIAWNADPIYRDLLRQLSPRQAIIAAMSFTDERISSRLQFNVCRTQYMELLTLLEQNVATPAQKELIDVIRNYPGPRDKMKNDGALRKRVLPLLQIVEV